MGISPPGCSGSLPVHLIFDYWVCRDEQAVYIIVLISVTLASEQVRLRNTSPEKVWKTWNYEKSKFEILWISCAFRKLSRTWELRTNYFFLKKYFSNTKQVLNLFYLTFKGQKVLKKIGPVGLVLWILRPAGARPWANPETLVRTSAFLHLLGKLGSLCRKPFIFRSKFQSSFMFFQNRSRSPGDIFLGLYF
jgi:hypothetical protein